MKPLHFVGTARKDLAGFPESARRRAGHELFMVQVGRKPNDYKPISTVGPTVPAKFAPEAKQARSE